MKEFAWSAIYVFLGGGMGSVFRFFVALGMQKIVKGSFPAGTLTVNVLGSFLIGVVIYYFGNKITDFQFWRQLLVIGFLGGFTTFSSFSMDTLVLFKNQEPVAALLNISGNILLCLVAVWLGSVAGKGLAP